MKKLILIRHGESQGNALGIIQGDVSDYNLTDNGKEEIKEVYVKNAAKLLNVDKILCSPLRRTIETAEILNEDLRVPLFIDENLKEVNPGVIGGLNKEFVKTNLPHLWEVWSDRKDLDSIPLAEKGDEFQARIINFLMQYWGKDDFCDVIVTHAAWIRTMVNTIENRERTNKFSIPNGVVIEKENIFEKLKITQITRAMSSEVYIVETFDRKYVVKIKNRKLNENDYEEKELLDRIELEDGVLPNILSMSNIDSSKSCKVLRFVGGKHKYGLLSKKEIDALIKKEKEIKDVLAKEKDKNFKMNDILKELRMRFDIAKNEYIRKIAKNLIIEGEKRKSLLEHNYVLSHCDLNRDNIMFYTDEKDKIGVNIVDWESLEYAPKDYQFASLLSSALLLEGESMDNIEKIIKENRKDVGDIVYLMQVRIFYGLYFFAENRDIGNDKRASKELLKKYFMANERIQLFNEKHRRERNKNEKTF